MSHSQDRKRNRPGAVAELLMPDAVPRARRTSARPRDVTDAEFEVIAAKPAAGSEPNAATTQPDRGPGWGPPNVTSQCPTDRVISEGGRLTLFSRRTGPGSGGSAMPVARPVFVTGVALLALASFWMAGGHTVFTGPTGLPAPTLPAAAVRASDGPPEAAVPIGTALEIQPRAPQTTALTPVVEIIRAAPRPARIERAGSILMIRPDGG